MGEVHEEKAKVLQEQHEVQKKDVEITRISAESQNFKAIVKVEKERIVQVEKQARAESQEALRRSQEENQLQNALHEKRLKEQQAKEEALKKAKLEQEQAVKKLEDDLKQKEEEAKKKEKDVLLGQARLDEQLKEME